MFRSTKAMLQSEKGSFRLFFAISNEETGVIPVRNGNVAMKNRNVAIDNGKVEVGERNVAETEEKFIKNPKDVSYKLSKGRKAFRKKFSGNFKISTKRSETSDFLGKDGRENCRTQ
jgi:hypothetical protein